MSRGVYRSIVVSIASLVKHQVWGLAGQKYQLLSGSSRSGLNSPLVMQEVAISSFGRKAHARLKSMRMIE